MIITATELKTNLGKYLTIATQEDVLITKNGRGIVKLVSVQSQEKPTLRSLRGILHGESHTRESIREERLAKYYEGSD